MAGGIRGITVEIGGDTTKLGKALSDVNKKSKDLQRELKGVNTLLKMDPGNVTLLKQKQDLLNGSISATREKLNTLKSTQEQVQAQFDKGEITEEQYRDFQREIVATEQKLKGLNDELDEFGSVGAQKVSLVGEKMQDVGGKIEDAGKKASVVSAGIVALGSACVGAFYELDEGYDTIITKTGASGEALDSLNESADNVFSNLPVDMADVGTAIGEVNTRFGYTGEKLEELSSQFLQFAEINGVDLNNSIGTVDKVLEQFNMSGEEAGGVLDLITLKAQETGIGADKLMDTVQKNGATFKDMGLGVNEAIVLLSQFEANGVNVETAVKGLQKATKEYTDEGLSMEDALGKTIDKIKNAKTDTEALAEAQEIFGVKGANEMAKAIREGRIDVDDLSKSMGDYAGTVEDTFNETLDPVDEAKVGFNNLKLVGAELGGSIQTALLPIINGLVNGLKNLKTWFDGLSPTTKTMIVVIAGIVASIGPLLIIIGKVVSSIGTIMTFAPKLVTAFNAVKTAFSTLGTTLLANPIAIVIIAVTALVGAFIYLWNNCEAFRQFWINLWENIKATVGPILEQISGYFSSAWEYVKSVWNSVRPYFSQIWSGIRAIFSAVKTVLGAYFRSAWEVIKLVWSVAVSYFRTIWSNIKAIFSVVKTFLGGAFSTAWTAIKAVWNAVTGYFRAIWNTIKGIFSVVKSVLTGDFRGAWEGIKGIVSTWKGYFSGVWNSIKAVFSSVRSWFSSTFSSAWTEVKNVFSSWGSFFSGLWSKITNTFSKIGTNISNAISGSVRSGLNGVISAIEGTINTGIGLINGAIGLINKLPGVSVGKIGRVSFPRLARGGVVDRPTFAEIGENGAEAIVPLENNTEWIQKVARGLNDQLQINAIGDNRALLAKLDGIYEKLGRLQIVLDTGVLVGEAIDKIDSGLATRQSLSARGV